MAQMMQEPISEYEQQALDFLKKTNTEFSSIFLKHGKHFQDDKETRDIYEITLKRNNREFIFNFGQSLNDSGFKVFHKKKRDSTNEVKFINFKFDNRIRNKDVHRKLLLSFLNCTAYEFDSQYKIMEPKSPNAYDVLACLTKYDVGSFEDFCSEFGYNDDSIKAKETYDAVVEEYEGLQKLYTDEDLDLLREIQ